jgi:hypothetical protein
MAARMGPMEKLRHYGYQVVSFENKKGWSAGRHTYSEYVFLLAVALWFAFVAPQWIGPAALLSAAILVTGFYILYLLILFFMSGGRGKMVDVI